MHYSLRSRFHGAILGLAIGAKQQNGGYKPCLLYPANLNQSLPQKSFSLECEAQIITLAEAGMKSLIQNRRFDAEDWHHAVKNSSLSPLHAIAATLPIALFYHENEIKLRENIQIALAAVGQDDPEIRDLALALGYAIAMSMQGKVYSAELISQTIAFIGYQTYTAQNLSKVKIFLEQNAGLETVVTSLERTSQPGSEIALAFYCYLSTLSDFRLALKRVAQKSDRPQLTGAITAALAGAYNGKSGIPASLRQQLSCPTPQPGIATSVTTEGEMLRLCDALVAVWSGVYEQANQLSQLSQIAAIAAPRAIGTR